MLKSLLIIALLSFLCSAQKPELIPSQETVTREPFETVQPSRLDVLEQNCVYRVDNSVYQLSKLQDDSQDYYVTDEDQIFGSIVFNFCRTVVNQTCQTTLAGLILPHENSTCVNLAGGDLESNVFQSRDYTRVNDSKGGLTIRYTGGSPCYYDVNKTNSLEINVYCDEDDNGTVKPVPTFYGIDTSSCIYSVNIKSKEGCYKFSINPLVEWVSLNANIFGAFLIVLGFAVGIFGRKLFKPTICVIGALVFVFFSTLLIFTVFFDRDTKQWAEWLAFVLCLILSFFVGLVLAKLSKIGVAVLAAWGGFCLGLVLYNAFIYKLELDNDHELIFWIFNILLALLGGALSFFFFNQVIIIATSFVGSYLFVRGISFYAGGYPDEIDLINWIKYGYGGMTPAFYGYMAGIFVLTVACIVIQCLIMKRADKTKRHPYHQIQ